MKAKRHEALAAVLLSGAVIFAGASLAAGAADQGMPGSTMSNSSSMPGPSSSMPGPAGAGAQTHGGPGTEIPSADTPNSDALPPPTDGPAARAPMAPGNESHGGPANTPRNDQASAGPGGDESSLGKRSTDTRHMSRRQAERTEKKITQELNREAAQGIAQADAGQPSNSRNRIGRP